jgi:VanZ family protein
MAARPVLCLRLRARIHTLLRRRPHFRPLHTAAQYFMGDAANNGWTFIHHYIRKTGHFTGYGLLSVVCFRGFWMTLRNTASRMKRTLGSHGLALAATLFVASADEIHQTFLPNRTGTFSDVVLDTSGGLAFQITLFLILLAAHTWSSQRSSRRDDDFEDTPIKIRRRLVLRRPTPRTFRMAIWNHHFQTLSHRIFTSHNQR